MKAMIVSLVVIVALVLGFAGGRSTVVAQDQWQVVIRNGFSKVGAGAAPVEVWKINQRTGEVFFAVRGLDDEEKVYSYPWTKFDPERVAPKAADNLKETLEKLRF